METRELIVTELDELLGLYLHMHVSDEPLPQRNVIEAVWQNIQDTPNFRYFGVFVEGRLVSSCTLSVVPNLSRGCRPYGLIENVVTHSDYRRRGYGKAVLKYSLEYAWSRNCYKVMLMTGRKTEAVYKFYESAGFNRRAKQAFLAKPENAV